MSDSPLLPLVDWFREELSTRNKRPDTIRTYTEAPRLFFDFLAETDPDVSRLPQVTRAHVAAFLRSQRERGLSDYSVLNRYRGLKAFFAWVVEEDTIGVPVSPMAGMKTPHVTEDPPDTITDADIKKLLDVCAGKDFAAVRDTAIVRMLMTGVRRGELATMQTMGLHFAKGPDESSWIEVDGKTGKRNVPFGYKTSKALRRYLNVRGEHDHAHKPDLWLGRWGPMKPNAFYLIIKRRAAEAGIGKVWLHLFRHTAVDAWLSAEGGMDALGPLMGWKGSSVPKMIDRYGAANANKRAMARHRRILPDDRV